MTRECGLWFLFGFIIEDLQHIQSAPACPRQPTKTAGWSIASWAGLGLGLAFFIQDNKGNCLLTNVVSLQLNGALTRLSFNAYSLDVRWELDKGMTEYWFMDLELTRGSGNRKHGDRIVWKYCPHRNDRKLIKTEKAAFKGNSEQEIKCRF